MRKKLKGLSILSVLAIALGACSTIQPTLNEFRADKNSIVKGDEVTVFWNVKDAESVEINEIGKGLPLVGNKTLKPEKTTTFTLTAINGKLIANNSLNVAVSMPEPPKPKTVPAVEKRNLSQSKYLKGIINNESVKAEDVLTPTITNIDLSKYPTMIRLFCSVKDQNGNFIANMAPPYNNEYAQFWTSVAENHAGKNVPISDFKVQEIREDVAPPFSTTFVLDYSGSMNADYPAVESALKQALTFQRPGKDDYDVIQFDDLVYNPIQLTNNTAETGKLIPFEKLMGATAFLDASITGISSLKGAKKEKVAILFTDGLENSSLQQERDLVDEARKTNTRVYIIGFGKDGNQDLQNYLTSIAQQTNGNAYFPATARELSDIFSEIYQMQKVYYVLTYATEANNVNRRDVKISMTTPAARRTIQAERPYFVRPEIIKDDNEVVIAKFDNGKADIGIGYLKKIQQLADLLKTDKNKKIIVCGHTDTQGSDALNNALSSRRAKALVQLLIKCGVDKKQISKTSGLGKKQPIHKDDREDWQKGENRRVAIKFI